MDNLALDYEKKERLENVQAKQAYLNRFVNAKADNYLQKKDSRETSVLRSRENLRFDVERHRSASDAYHKGERKEYDENEKEVKNNGEIQDDEQSRSDRLKEAVKDSLNLKQNKMKDVAALAEVATPMGAISLARQINFLGDMPFVAALGAAIFKDLLDGPFNVVLIGALFSILCSIFIFMMLFLADANKKRKSATGLLKKGLILIAGGVVDAIPGIGILPIETLTVGIIYMMTLVERKNMQGKS